MEILIELVNENIRLLALYFRWPKLAILIVIARSDTVVPEREIEIEVTRRSRIQILPL